MYLELELFRASPATHIVSLGEACANAYNLRRYYNFGGAFPFDWWVSDAEGLVRFLESPSIEFLYDVNRLTLSQTNDSVRNHDFNFIFQHEFKHDWSLPGHPIRADWTTNIEKPAQRSEALLNKFLALNANGNRVVFIRNGKTSPKIIASLEKLFPLPEWTFVHIDYIANGENGWKGDTSLWDEALARLNITLDLTKHKPFRETDPDVEFAASLTMP